MDQGFYSLRKQHKEGLWPPTEPGKDQEIKQS